AGAAGAGRTSRLIGHRMKSACQPEHAHATGKEAGEVECASREVSAEFFWRPPGVLAKGDTKCARLRVAESQCDLHDRIGSIRQQDLGPRDASLDVVLMGGNSTRLLECSTEMMLAQASEPSEREERYLLAHMFFDVGSDSAHLPAGEAAASQR